MKLVSMISISISLVMPTLLAQTAKPSFQAASVKLNPQSGSIPASLSVAGNRYRATGVPLRRLIMEAYNLRDWQLTGGPSWISSDQWDVEAVAADGTPILFFNPEDPNRPTEGSLMMQSLIENRFQFKFHRDVKKLPAYELTVTRSGPKFKRSIDQQSPAGRLGRGEIDVQAQPFATFAYYLSRFLDRTLINKVDLTGLYDIKLQWNPDLKTEVEASTVSDKPSIFTALQEQLGLKLDSGKAPVQVIVIDSVQKPSQN
jgi:uncharacterized protein (TIGR03435 family)